MDLSSFFKSGENRHEINIQLWVKLVSLEKRKDTVLYFECNTTADLVIGATLLTFGGQRW